MPPPIFSSLNWNIERVTSNQQWQWSIIQDKKSELLENNCEVGGANGLIDVQFKYQWQHFGF